MSVITALESPIAMEASRDQYDRYRSSITTSPTSTPLTPAFQSLSLSPPGSANRRKSAKPSPYRLRTTSGYSLYVLDDVPKDHQQGMSPTMSPAYGSTSGRSLASAGSISASQSESLPSMNAEELPRTPLFNPVGNDALEITLNNPETAKRLLHFAQSRGCGQNIEFLMQIRNYTKSLKQYAAQLSSISKTFTSVTATSPLNLPPQLSKSLNASTRHVSNSLIPGLDALFGEPKSFIQQRVASDLFPAFVKHQLAASMGVCLAFGTGDGPAPRFPGLKESFCICNPNELGNPVECASDGFEDMLGYSRYDVLGRNCGFLQGHMTDGDTVHRIQQSMHHREGFTELILNYRGNGQPFWNLLHISPLLDAAGRVRLYLGAQVDVSASIENGEDLLKLLRYDANEDVRKRSQAEMREMDLFIGRSPTGDEEAKVPRGLSHKSSRKNIFKAFKRSNEPLPSARSRTPSRGPESPIPSPSPQTYSTRSVLRTLATQRSTAPTPYSRFIVLQHVPSYDAALAASALQKQPGMRSGVPSKLNIVFSSEAVNEVLGLGMAADAIVHRDIFDVLAEQTNCASITKDFKSNVRNTVLIDGRTAAVELVLVKTTASPKWPSIPRLAPGPDRPQLASGTSRGDARNGGGATRLEKMMSYWTPLKDMDDEIQYVMLVLSPASVPE